MKSNELIHRYFHGIASEDEVQELERRLKNDIDLQDEFLLYAETDAQLFQESQLGTDTERVIEAETQTKAVEPITVKQNQSSNVWKWMSGVSTVAATTLLIMLVLHLPPQRDAVASLGELAVNVSWSDQNIWSAAGQGDLHGLRRELNRNVSVDAWSNDELTPLHLSALFNQKDSAEFLIAEGANVSLADAEGNTALHMSAFLGHTDVVRVLLSGGAQPGVRNKMGFSVSDLVAVAWNNRLERFYQEVARKLDVTLDLEQIRSERSKILNLLSMSELEADNSTPSTSIWQAAMTGNILAIKQHIAAGTDVNSQEDLAGNTPLTLTAIFGQPEVAKLLVDAGADIEHRNKSGDTAIHLACFFCQPEIVKLLISSGANPNKTNKHNHTCLESVSIELNVALKAVYVHVYDSLNLQLDIEHIRKTRIQIANILAAHVAENHVPPEKLPSK